MNFFSALKMECYKAVKRKTSKLLLLFIMLPLFYGIAFFGGSQAVTIGGQFSAIGFSSSCWMLLGYTGLTGILFVILTVNYLGREKEDGQLKLLFLKSNNRKNTFLAKYFAVLFLIGMSYLVMYAATVGVYYICIAGNMEKQQFCFGLEDVVLSITSDIIILVQVIMVVNVVFMLCAYYKSFFCILTGIGCSLGFTILQSVPALKLADPMYIMNLYNEDEISTIGVWIYCFIYLIVSTVPIWIGINKFQRIEIK